MERGTQGDGRGDFLMLTPKEGVDYFLEHEVELALEATSYVRVWEYDYEEGVDLYDLFRHSDYDLDVMMKSRTGRTRRVTDEGKLFDETGWKKTRESKKPVEVACPKCGFLSVTLTIPAFPGWRFFRFRCPEHGIWYEKQEASKSPSLSTYAIAFPIAYIAGGR